MKTGGQLLVDCLKAHGTERVFCVPGESYLPVLDALYDSNIKTIVCRHEGGAAIMAEATSKLTNMPGICMVTRGPGASNAAHGLHIARQDSSPMILFIGHINTGHRDREAWQEIDYKAMFGSIAKWVGEIDRPDRVEEMVSRAFHTATSGRPGPVVLVLPEDMLKAEAVSVAEDQAWFKPLEIAPSTKQMQKMMALLMNAKRPMAVIGGSGWTPDAVARFKAFAERFHLPVGVTFRRQMLFDHTHPNYAGDVGLGINPKLAARVAEADLLLLIGTRFSEVASSAYSLTESPVPKQLVVHVHSGAEEIGRIYRPDLGINATMDAFTDALAPFAPEVPPLWAEDTLHAHADYMSWSTPPETAPGDVNMGDVMSWLNANLKQDAILCNGAGNYAIWLHRYYRFRAHGSQLAPTSGSMGYGLPAAIAGKLERPGSTVIAFGGDGCFMMTAQEFATAVQFDVPVIMIVVDNGMYGTIRMHQERDYPGRVSATDLANPDFAAMARSFGGFGTLVKETEGFAEAFRAAQASGKPALIHVKVDPEALTPTKTLSDIRDAR